MEKKEAKKEPKKAPSNLPKKIWKNTVFKVFLMLVWVGSVVIATQFIVGYPMLWILGKEALSQPVWMAIYEALVYILAMALIILVPKRNTNRRTELGLRGLPTWTDIGLALVGFIVYLLLAAGLLAIFSFFPWFDAEEAQEIGFSIYAAGLDRAIAFFALVVIAPIAEEIIFRGWLYGKMRGKLNRKVSNQTSMLISIFLVSLLFGIVHLQWNVGVNVFAMSVVLCGLREITGTIYSGILLHMLKNGVAFYLLFILGIN